MRSQWMYVWIWIRKQCLFVTLFFLSFFHSLFIASAFSSTLKNSLNYLSKKFLSHRLPFIVFILAIKDRFICSSIYSSLIFSSPDIIIIYCCHHIASWLWAFDCFQHIVENIIQVLCRLAFQQIKC